MDPLIQDSLVPEARELLTETEELLLEMERTGPNAEHINAIFRAVHTIKGSAGLFSLQLITEFTQILEDVLDRLRAGELPFGESEVSLLLSACDYIGHLIDNLDAGDVTTDPAPDTRAVLLGQMCALLKPPEVGRTIAPSANKSLRQSLLPQGLVQHYHFSLRFKEDVLQQGVDPLEILAHLSQQGTVMYAYMVTDKVPRLADLDPVSFHLGFELGLRSEQSEQELRGALAVVEHVAEVAVLPPELQVAEYVQLLRSMGDGHQELGTMLVRCGAISQADMTYALRKQAQSIAAGAPVSLPQILESEKLVPTPVINSALSAKKEDDDRKNQQQRVIKIEASRLDQLITLVGELVIASEEARIRAADSRQMNVVESVAKMSQIVEHVRDYSLGMRMIPIGEVFRRFPRVVRDVARELNKSINLEITGAETELDKSMVDRLADPLTHIVRNAIDHGIESVQQRRSADKSSEGHLHLHAYHESGNIVIEVRDDGRGLDTARILEKAQSRGLVEKGAELSDAQIRQLIFAPGFSTAATVTDLSGRGVGMDVVKRNIEELRGLIELESETGEWTCVRLRLPLTLAIIDGFQVGVGNNVYVLPLEAVEECVDASALQMGERFFALRGDPLPCLRLRELFHIPPGSGGRESLVVVSQGHERIGLLVDRLLGDFQAVIKPLGQLFRGITSVSSSTILGDGRVGLVLDVGSLLAQATAMPQQALH